MPGRYSTTTLASRFNNYQNQEKDDETQLLNFELRQYDPRIGRWFNPDPMRQYHSPYLAMGNNPISFADPTGGEDGDVNGGTLPIVVVCGNCPKENDPLGLFTYRPNHNTNNNDEYNVEKYNLYWSKVSPERAIANKKRAELEELQQRYQQAARDERRRLELISEANSLDKIFWMANYKGQSYGWTYAENQAVSKVILEVSLCFLPVGEIVEGARVIGIFAKSSEWVFQALSKSEMAGIVGKGVTQAGTKVSGWVERSVFKSLDGVIQKKVAAAIEKGIVAPTGQQGIIRLTATEAAQTGYSYKVKILGIGGDIRIYGNPLENGHIFFTKVIGH